MDIEHATEECLGLRTQVAYLLNKGYLKDLMPSKVKDDNGSRKNLERPKRDLPPAPPIYEVKFINGGFSGETKNTLGEIYLPTYDEGFSSNERYGVLECLLSYNAILGRPWIQNFGAIPTEWGIATIKGEQKSTKECYTESLKLSKPDQVILDPEYPDRYVVVGSDVPNNVRPELVSFLKSKSTCFSWSHFDMTGIDANVIIHKLNIDTSCKPVQQKRRKFAPKRNAIINEEVGKLLDMGMIREVMYIEWLANVVAVRKKNGK
ncbi:uncharacterized protein LOC141630327 [Silene latifolia]|uniref:uncharacterized protein LOC141630327 n=1 Tax=Silene latifolia TaxID=37657 RepID=UPI003D7735D2